MGVTQRPVQTPVPGERAEGPARPRAPLSPVWGIVPVVLLGALVVILRVRFPHAREVYEPPWVLPILNTVFLTCISCVVAFVAMRSYLASGSLAVLLLGCGVFTFGLGGLFAGWLVQPAGPNAGVTVFNVAALASSLFHAVGAAVSLQRRPPRTGAAARLRWLSAGYFGGAFIVLLTAVAAAREATPLFVIQGVGSTPLRAAVLTATLTFFGAACVGTLHLPRQPGSRFRHWYALALASLVVAMAGLLVNPTVGSILGWVARSAQYVGALYFLLAVAAASREAQARGLPLNEAIAELLSQPAVYWQDILATVSDAIVACDERGRLLHWNRAAERIFGYTQGEALGRGLEIVLPAGQATEVSRLTGAGDDATVEIELMRSDGTCFPGEASVSSVRLPTGDLTALVLRDISTRKEAEEEREQLHAQYLAAERARAELAETLNRETSHRVKNNLAMIAGLLQMQQAEARHPEVAAALRDTTGRILAFAGLHEQLQATLGEEADLLGIVRRIADTTANVFTFRGVAVNVEGDAVRYPRRVATNLALMANELITNAIKHGGSGSDGGFRVNVRVEQTASALRVAVWNSGTPIPADFDPAQQRGLGLRLVRSLADELYRGAFRIAAERGGTVAEVVMPLGELRES